MDEHRRERADMPSREDLLIVVNAYGSKGVYETR